MGLIQDLIDAKLEGERVRRKKMGIKEDPVADEAMIKEVKGNDVSLDLNHPLAGYKIQFKVEIIKIYD